MAATVEKGASKKLSLDETGWLMQVTLITDDCYGTVQVSWQGADLERREFSWTPELFADLGGFAQDPSGWVQRYTRPNPYSTAGVFVAIIHTGGSQGSTLPYVPTVTVEVSLGSESTQEHAYVTAFLFTIAITDREKFIRSLRRVLEARADLWVDPALLSVGPEAEFKQGVGKS